MVYVDDIAIIRNIKLEIGLLKAQLEKKFKLKHLGYLSYFLGVEVAYSEEGAYLSQRKYALEILNDSGLLEAKPSNVPMERMVNLRDEFESIQNPTFYRKLVGKLIFLNITRLDLSFLVHWLSQFMKDPKEVHLRVLLKVARYFKKAPGQGLLCKKIQYFGCAWLL